MSEILLGVLGCGSVTIQNHAKIINTLKNRGINAIGCFDIQNEQSKQLSRILSCVSFKTQEELMASKANTILIATPPVLHYSQIKESLTAGKNVICEKPFVITKEEAEDVVSYAQSAKREVFVGHFRRAFPSMLIARNYLLDKCALIQRIEATEGSRFAWTTFSKYVTTSKWGNVIYDTGSHLIDQLLFVLSLDKGELQYSIRNILKDHPENTHEIKADFEIKQNKINIPLRIMLSRKKQLTNLIRIVFDDSELLISTTFDDKVLLLRNKKVFIIKEKLTNIYCAKNSMDCFALEYLLLKERDNELRGIFDAKCFINLTSILHAVTEYNGEKNNKEKV